MRPTSSEASVVPSRRRYLWATLVSCATLFTSPAVTAQDDGRSTLELELQQRVNRAIDRGVKALLREQEIDGSWREHATGYPNGQTALCLYTLLKCDVKPEHPAVRRAVDFLRTRPPRKTYSTGAQIMAICALDPALHRDWIGEMADELASWQRGGYGYPDHHVDLSNTQYAALGLRAAAQHGHRIPAKAWTRMAEWTLAQQQSDPGAAGFRYTPSSTTATGSMTAAGVGVLAICAEQLSRTNREIAPAIERGMRWLDEQFTASTSPVVSFSGSDPQNPDGGRVYYYLYGLERVGALLQATHIGEHDWYREGAIWLVGDQQGSGLWADNQSNTCFALLFLARATSKIPYTGDGGEKSTRTYGRDDPLEDVSIRAAGKGPLSIWISSFGTQALEDFAWEEDGGKGLRVIRVEYRIEDPGAEEGSVLLATVEGDSAQPSRGNRFPARLAIERAGVHRLFARVVVLPPGDEALVEEDGDGYPLESRSLEVKIDRGDDPRLDGYASDARSNLLNVPRVKATASSQREGEFRPELAVDGLIGTRWMSADDDALPFIQIELPRAARANTVLLTHATDQPGGDPSGRGGDPARTARIRRVRVLINGEKKGLEAELEPDERVKTVIELKKTTKVRSIRIEVLEVFPSAGERDAVGFAEVELVSRRRKRS